MSVTPTNSSQSGILQVKSPIIAIQNRVDPAVLSMLAYRVGESRELGGKKMHLF